LFYTRLCAIQLAFEKKMIKNKFTEMFVGDERFFRDIVEKKFLPQDFYFHVNGSIGIVQKIEFEIRPDLGCTTFKTSSFS